MAGDKRYYWMKLQESFFEDETVEWLGEQPNGDTYIIFLLKLCLKALKTNGVLIRAVGNMFIPYDAEKLAEMTKIDIDTVRVAMNLFQQIGLIEVWDGGEIYVAVLEDMVGSETKWAAKKRLYRNSQAQIAAGDSNEDSNEDNNEDNNKDNVQAMSDKSIEYKSIENKSIEKKESKKKKADGSSRRFTPPTLAEVQEYCQERGNRIDAEHFLSYNEARGWMLGKSKMKDWKAAIRQWERQDARWEKQDAERTQGWKDSQRQGASAEAQERIWRENSDLAERMRLMGDD